MTNTTNDTVTKITYMGKTIECYGEMDPSMNIIIVCEDEFGDRTYCDGFENWTEAVQHLHDNYRTDIAELESC